MDPPRHAELVSDVLRASACGRDSSAVQASEGPIPILARERRRGRGQRQVAVGLSLHGGDGKKLLGPGKFLLLLLEREHRRDEARGGLAIRTNNSRPAGTVGARKEVGLGVALLSSCLPCDGLRVVPQPDGRGRVRRLATSLAVPSPGRH